MHLTDFLAETRLEVSRARAKFPETPHTLAALMEEVGELAKALLEGEPVERVRAEAIQVACMAARMATEGDGKFPITRT